MGEIEFPPPYLSRGAIMSNIVLHDAWRMANIGHDTHIITWHSINRNRVTTIHTGRKVSQAHTVIQRNQHGKKRHGEIVVDSVLHLRLALACLGQFSASRPPR